MNRKTDNILLYKKNTMAVFLQQHNFTLSVTEKMKMSWNYNPIEDENNDVDELREKLRGYYGTAMTSGLPMTVIDLAEVDDLDDNEVREKARKNGIR